MTKQVFKIFKWFAIVLLLLVGLFIGASVLLKDKLIRMGINAINTELVIPVKVNEIDFSLLRSFPYASMVLNNVVIISPESLNREDFDDDYADTLLYISKLSLSFHIGRLLDNELELKSVKINSGRINILVDADGSDNYHILKPSKTPDKNSSKAMQVMLNQLIVHNTRLIYFNAFKNTGVQFQMPDFTIKGKFDGPRYNANTKGRLNLNWMVANNVKIVPLAPTQLQMNVNFNNDTITIRQGIFDTKGLNFEIAGKVSVADPVNVNFDIKGKQLEVASLLRYFNLVNQKKQLKIKSTGVLDFETKISGRFDNKHTPQITARFGISKATVDYPDLKLHFNKVALKGGFNNGAGSKGTKARIAINNFECQTAQGIFKGTLMVENFVHPVIKSDISFEGLLDEWNRLLFSDDESLSGHIAAKISVQGPLDFSKKFTINDFLKLAPKGEFILKKTGYCYSSKICLTNLVGQINLDGDILNFSKVSGNYGSTAISYSGQVTNVFTSAFSPYPTLHVAGNIVADKIDYKQVVPFFEDETPDTSKFNYDIDAKVFVNHYSDADFKAENISLSLFYKSDALSVNTLNFYTSDGHVNTSFTFKPQGNDYMLSGKANVDNIDMNELFKTFKNFDQSYVTDQNISGKISSNFHLSLPFKKYQPDWQKMDFLGHVKISQGKLANIETTRQLASFTKIDDFNQLEFSTLENDLLISGGKVSFSKMEIVSNACDITLYGHYYFTGDYEYHFTMILTDFMRGKAKRIRQEVTPYGIVENDGLGHTTLYLVATCEGGKTKIRFDRQELKEHFKGEMKQQKQEVKTILKKEFGLFKNDSTVKPDKKDKQPKKEFEIEWEDE